MLTLIQSSIIFTSERKILLKINKHNYIKSNCNVHVQSVGEKKQKAMAIKKGE